jgi:hypothetical protein
MSAKLVEGKLEISEYMKSDLFKVKVALTFLGIVCLLTYGDGHHHLSLTL